MRRKVLLISGSNPERTPFIGFYKNILERAKVDYDILYWNRDINDTANEIASNHYVYNEPLYIYSNPLKKIIATYKFYRYGKRILKEGDYSKIICFTVFSSIFFQHFLKTYYKGSYIFDIRDYSPLINRRIFRNLFEALIRNSYTTIISSDGFKKWLPEGFQYVISHNIDSSLLSHLNVNTNHDKLNILTIGFFVRFAPNGFLIRSFANSNEVILSFVGYGPSYSEYECFCKDNQINNVVFKGRYKKEKELEFYDHCDMVNILLPHTLNSDTCMSNRFYNAVVARKPMIVNSDCYQAYLVNEYKLGIVIDKYENLDKQILGYYYTINWDEYYKGCDRFIQDVKKDNSFFENTILNFIK